LRHEHDAKGFKFFSTSGFAKAPSAALHLVDVGDDRLLLAPMRAGRRRRAERQRW